MTTIGVVISSFCLDMHVPVDTLKSHYLPIWNADGTPWTRNVILIVIFSMSRDQGRVSRVRVSRKSKKFARGT